jgi:4-amino-4-deoxy-L-arabinose transferase-like glycosyltransferase
MAVDPRADMSGGGAHRLGSAIPAAGWVCAVVAILNAVCWSLITPPFQVPDEPSHFAYVKQLAEAHRLPSSHAQEFSPEETRVLADLRPGSISVLPATGTISSLAQQRKLESDLASAARLPREGSDAAGVATSEPPLYYLLETIPYVVGSAGNLLTRLALMRLFSALFAGITALFAFLFVREALPRGRASWAAAGLGIAFAPLLGFTSGAVTPDSLLFAVSAALFWALARAFRHGLTDRVAIAIGALTAIGLLTKVNFIGLLPGVTVGLVIVARRAGHCSRAAAYRSFGLAAGVAVIPLVLVGILGLSAGSSTPSLISSSAENAVHSSSIGGAISSTWQLFLPRLPGMKNYDPGVFTTRQVWFNGFVGQYGWVETAFPAWVYDVALICGVAILLALGRSLVKSRRALRDRLPEAIVYIIMAAGLMAVIGGAAYFSPGAGSFTQARYLLPLLALLAAALCLASRAAGRRWEAVLGSVLVLVMLTDDIFSQLLVVARYYG